MNKDEFKKFCNTEFSKRGFKKRKNTYYLASAHGLLCGLTLQGSYGTAYYINCAVFIGDYSNTNIYPTHYEADLFQRPVCVPSKDTFKGEQFMTAMIEHESYTAEELRPYFSKAFEEIIMPPIVYGKQELIKNIDQWWFPLPIVRSKEEILRKLDA